MGFARTSLSYDIFFTHQMNGRIEVISNVESILQLREREEKTDTLSLAMAVVNNKNCLKECQVAVEEVLG